MECLTDCLAGLFQLFNSVHIVPYFAEIVLVNIYPVLKLLSKCPVGFLVPDSVKIILMQIPEADRRFLGIATIR